MKTHLDADGQPKIDGYNYNRRVNRAINELIGMLRGVVADNYISEAETEALAKWMLGNREVIDTWPVKPLALRLNKIYEDGVATEEERDDLKLLVNELIGRQDDDCFEFTPSDLPLTKPAPDVIFDRNEFVLTGKFLYGTRKNCEKQIELIGGRCADTVRLQTSFLVVGTLMSRDWKFSTHGLKIQRAVDYSSRCPIAIISEKHWESFLLRGSQA
jgi:NAD-dependent DNA ligase